MQVYEQTRPSAQTFVAITSPERQKHRKARLMSILNDGLPTLPSYVFELNTLLSSSSVDLKRVGKVIRHDPSLSAQVLRLCNSALFSLRRRVLMPQFDLTRIGKADEGPAAGDTTAMIGLAGAICGVLSIRCKAQTAESVAGRMLGSVGAINPSEVPDAMAEICNMDAGNFRSKITPLADNCLLSVPMVIRGDDYEMVTVEGEQISVCVSYENSPIYANLVLHP